MSSNNSSWARGAKVSNDYKDSFSRKKEKEKKKEIYNKSYGNRNKSYDKDEDPIPIKKEFNIYDHPEMTPNDSFYENYEKSYLEKCKIQKEEDYEKINTLPLGWVAFKGNKGSTQIKVSRNNIDYYDTINETYTNNELENMNLQEEYENIMNLEVVLDNIYLKRLNESIKYFNLTNENNIFLDVLERQNVVDNKYDKIDEELLNQSDSEEDSESEYYDSDEN